MEKPFTSGDPDLDRYMEISIAVAQRLNTIQSSDPLYEEAQEIWGRIDDRYPRNWLTHLNNLYCSQYYRFDLPLLESLSPFN